MTTLKLLQEEQKNKCEPAKASENRSIQKNDDLIDLFPSPRYFQVHFQHLHDNTENNQAELARLKDHLAKVEDKLDRLMMVFQQLY